MARPQPIPRIEIARLEEIPDSANAASAMLALGAIAIFFAVFLESSAIRLAAWGAIWTGWNVLWGALALFGRKRSYIITRDAPDDIR